MLKTLRAYPDALPALQLMGVVACELGQYETAIDHLKRAVRAHPGSASALFNLGKAQRLAGLPDEALTSLAAARHLAPDMPQIYLEYGNALLDSERDDEALANYQRALQIDPHLSSAHLNSGLVLLKKGAGEAANAAFKRFLEFEPDDPNGLFRRAICQQDYCDWQDYDARISKLLELARNDRSPTGTPISLFLSAVCDDNGLLRSAADKEMLPVRAVGGTPERKRRPRPDKRIRIAYVSADFRQHAVAYLTAGLFEAHDRRRFEIVGVSVGPNDNSDMRHRLEQAFDRFEDLQHENAEAIAGRIRELDVDIAVDLTGHTKHSKTQLFLRRPASIQVNFLGFPGTMGGDAYDYMVTDPFIATDGLRRNASEKLVILPDCYQPNDYKRQIVDATPRRLEEGLPATGFVFCSFNHMRKITPGIFDIWMRILSRVDGSVLWLPGTGATAESNLRGEAQRRGVNPSRLVFAKRKPLEQQHLARIRLADLFLDTFPYTAHTTATDALWMGCPVVTMTGNSFASRVCGSLLRTVGLPELAVSSLEAYEALALRLAGRPDELRALKARLIENQLTSPLFDTQLFCRNLERAYEEMIRMAAQADDLPRSICENSSESVNCKAGMSRPSECIWKVSALRCQSRALGRISSSVSCRPISPANAWIPAVGMEPSSRGTSWHQPTATSPFLPNRSLSAGHRSGVNGRTFMPPLCDNSGSICPPAPAAGLRPGRSRQEVPREMTAAERCCASLRAGRTAGPGRAENDRSRPISW